MKKIRLIIVSMLVMMLMLVTGCSSEKPATDDSEDVNETVETNYADKEFVDEFCKSIS